MQLSMNTTRLMLNNTHDLFIPIGDNCLKWKNKNQHNTFLLYFGLPNSPITTVVDDDDILVSISDSEVERDSDKLTLSDADEDRSNGIIYKTFFTHISHKFSVFNALSFEELPSELFLKTCEDYFSIVGKFNSPIFAPLKADVNGNINKLRQKINQNPKKFQTLYGIVNDEIEARTTNVRNSATDALLWLKRAFEFVAGFLHEFGMGDKTLADAVNKAYEQSLSRYHGMLARNVFSFALRAVPDNVEFLRSLATNPADATGRLFEHQVFNEMLEHASDMSSVLQKITFFYSKYRLESTKSVT